MTEEARTLAYMVAVYLSLPALGVLAIMCVHIAFEDRADERERWE